MRFSVHYTGFFLFLSLLLAACFQSSSPAEPEEIVPQATTLSVSSQRVLNEDAEVGKLVLEQADENDWLTVDLLQTYAEPVVIAQPLSFNGGHPAMARVGDVSESSFQIQIDEWDYLDGGHVAEEVSYVVAERGELNLNGLAAVAGKVNLNQSWKTVDLSTLSETPVILSQTQTTNGGSAVVTRHRNVSNASFDVRLQEEESQDGSHNTEEVGYIAFEQATAPGAEAKTLSSVREGFETVTFANDYVDPIFLAGMQTYNGGDTAALRYRDLTASSTQVKVEEEKSKDAELTHNAEAVGVVVVEGQTDEPDPTGDLYVSPAGSDGATGTLNSPFLTVSRCAEVVMPGGTCWLRGGVYRETVRPSLSGERGAAITFRSYPGERALLSGADVVTGWEPHEGSIYKVNTALTKGYNDSLEGSELLANQIFVDGLMMNEARYPNGTTDLLRPKLASKGVDVTDTTLTIDNSDLPNVPLEGAVVWVNEWFVSRTAVVTSSGPGSLSAEISDSGKWQRNPFWFYLQGALGLLDEAGEWYYDAAQETLYLWTPGGGVPEDVEAKVRNDAFDLRGLSNITLRDLDVFAATVVTDDASANVVLDGLDVRYVSHYATLPDLPAERTAPGTDNFGLIGAHIHDSGIQLLGTGHTLTNSTVSHSAGNLVLLDGTGHEVSNNLLENSNYLSSYAASIQVAGDNHLITQNTMRGAGRSAVNVDWKLTGLSLSGVELSYNDITEFGTLSTDLGAVYLCCFLDIAGTSIQHNWIHDAQAFSPFWGTRGVYLDLNVYNSLIHNNVIWDIRGGKESFSISAGSNRGEGEKIFNNTLLLPVGTFDESVEARNNLFLGQTAVGAEPSSNNLFEGTDPLFTNPEEGNFSLGAGSPAVDAGTVISGITDGFAGAAPDVGAYELGQPVWQPGQR